MSARTTRLACRGCGAAPSDDEPFPFRCPNANGDDIDHVLERVLDTTAVAFPLAGQVAASGDDEPFVRYRALLHSHGRALAAGIDDGAFVSMVREIDDAIRHVEGRAFRVTPFAHSATVSSLLGFEPPGEVWIKDETGNVAGSHKARHLMGVVMHLEVAERAGLASRDDRPDLAIASCGNAALAAAVLARATARRLQVFVPVDADATVVRELIRLRADVVTCPRTPGIAGDPTFTALRDALAAGALPFTCQGPQNGLVIEGGETLGWEMVSALGATGTGVDHLVVQVGGGALASACIAAFREAVALGALDRSPRIHTVQTASAHPLERAYQRVRAGLPDTPGPGDIEAALARAVRHRSAYMWPWEDEPKSIATGILDDETYDWLAVVRGMLETGGQPVVVGEDLLSDANDIGHAAGFTVSPTGSAGLAGLLALVRSGVVGRHDRVAVLFTGVER